MPHLFVSLTTKVASLSPSGAILVRHGIAYKSPSARTRQLFDLVPKSKQHKASEGTSSKTDSQAAIQKVSSERVIAELLDDQQYGRTYTADLNIQLKEENDVALFQWLCCSILFSSGLTESLSLRACRILLDGGLLDSAAVTRDTPSDTFVSALDRKYLRKEQTAKYLHNAAEMLLDKYSGSLMKLREEAGRDPEEIRKKLQEIKGLGEVGVNIFFREAQLVWPELVPFVDARAAEAASEMGLPREASQLYKLVDSDVHKLATLEAALVRVNLAKDKGLAEIAEGVEAGAGEAGKDEKHEKKQE